MEKGQVRYQPPPIPVRLKDYAQHCIAIGYLLRDVSDACRQRRWEDAWKHQQEMEKEIELLGEAVVAGKDRERS